MNVLQDFFREGIISYYNLHFLSWSSNLKNDRTKGLLRDYMYSLDQLLGEEIFNMILLSDNKIESLKDIVENYNDFILQGNCKFEESQVQKILANINNKIIIKLEEAMNSDIPEEFKFKLEDRLRYFKNFRFEINKLSYFSDGNCIKTNESFITFCNDLIIK